MSKEYGNDRYFIGKLYRCKNRRRPYRKQWYRKKAKDKKGFTRYSTGPKWAGQHDPYKPAFWRTYQPGIYKQRSDDEILPSGYGRTETWIALCKSWNGFLLAKREGDHEDMKQYAMQIRTLKKDLNLPQSQFDMFTPEELEWMERESDLVAKEEWYATSV